MKKRLIIFALLAFALGGCQTEAGEETRMEEPTPPVSELPGESPVPVETPALETKPVTPSPTSPEPAEEMPLPTETAVEASEEPSESPEGNTRQGEHPADEEVLEVYHRALEAYNWFSMIPLPIDQEAEGRGEDGTYHPVTDERFPTMAAFQTYLKGLFSDEVVDSLLPIDGKQYVEIDGVLCGRDGGRGANINTGAVTEMVIWSQEGAGLCNVHVTVELLWEDPQFPDGVREYDFPYQKVGDKWVFTHFEAIM